MKAVLSIAGSDSSGGAGIQADIKTITAHKLFAETVITALTAQNTMGVSGVEEVTSEFVGKQMDAVFTDIVPDAVKIGMVSSQEIIEVIAEKLVKYQARNIVLDPVMVATTGAALISDQAIDALKEKLFPLADVITPNLPEAEVLCGFPILTEQDRERAALRLTCNSKGVVLVKGGHSSHNADSSQNADDVFAIQTGELFWLHQDYIPTQNTHGTGCTLSSAIACGLASGLSIEASLRQAKAYVTGALLDGLDIGKGRGPLNHMWEY